jgi:hypothetical protein
MGESYRSYGPDRRVQVIACTRGRGGKKGKPCTFCSSPTELLCDGPGCDVPVCGACAKSVRPLDKDFCPRCIVKTVDGCAAAELVARIACLGPETERSQDGRPICLAHSVAFTWFLRNGGYDVWRRRDIDQAAKRVIFKSTVEGLWEQLEPIIADLSRRTC